MKKSGNTVKKLNVKYDFFYDFQTLRAVLCIIANSFLNEGGKATTFLKE